MALNSTAKTSDASLSSLNVQAPAPRQDAATPINAEDAASLSGLLKAGAGAANPVAEVQAKLRAAMAAQPKTSRLQDAAFHTLLILACAVTTALGIVLGVVCVLFGAAMFLFPISAGTALGAFVLLAAVLFYVVYIRGGNSGVETASGDTFESLSAGRFNATGVA